MKDPVEVLRAQSEGLKTTVDAGTPARRLQTEAERMYGNMRSLFSDESILVLAGHLIRLASDHPVQK